MGVSTLATLRRGELAVGVLAVLGVLLVQPLDYVKWLLSM